MFVRHAWRFVMLDVENQDVEYQNQPAADKKKIIAMPAYPKILKSV